MEPLIAAATLSPMLTSGFALLLVGLVACLAFEEKLHAKKSVIAGSFAIVSLFLGAAAGILPFEPTIVGSQEMLGHDEFNAQIATATGTEEKHFDATQTGDDSAASHHGEELHWGGHSISMPVYIPAIDWGVIAIILGSSLFVDVTSKSGLFTWIAIRVTKASGGDPLRLLAMYGGMTVAFSAVLNNVTAMIIIGSLTAVSLNRLKQNDKLLGFLLVEGLLTNIGGLLTLISSVPNIIVGTAANISFVEFFLKSAPYVAITTVVTIWMGARRFHIKSLSDDKSRAEARELVSNFDENDGIESWGFFWFGTAMLVLFILTIATTSVLPVVSDLQMGFVALAFAGIMLLRYKSEADQFYKAVDWDLLGFFMALFVVIFVMEHAGVLGAIGSGIQFVMRDLIAPTAEIVDTVVLLGGSAVFSSVTDNIPLAAMLASILSSLGTPESSGLWWSVVFGANLGGNITPIGSASTLVAVTIIHKHGLKLSFAGFVKAAAPFAIVHLLMATVYVILFLR